jgi:hypothetical protein
MKMKDILKVALGTGLFVLDQSDRAKKSVQERVMEGVDDLRGLAHDRYRTAAENFEKATRVLRRDDKRAIWNVLRFAAGLGVGVGIGLFVAPANGEDTRRRLAEKAQELNANVRERLASSHCKTTSAAD